MKLVALAICAALTCGAAAAADTGKDRIDADYKAAKAQCRKLDDRKQRKVCDTQARGKRDIARADARADAKHGDWINVDRERQKAIGKNTDAQYSAAKDHCKDLPDDRRERCVADAKKKFGKG